MLVLNKKLVHKNGLIECKVKMKRCKFCKDIAVTKTNFKTFMALNDMEVCEKCNKKIIELENEFIETCKRMKKRDQEG